MEINYINLAGATLYGIPQKKINKIKEKAKKTCPNLDIPNIYQDGRNAIAAINKSRVVGWIDFETNSMVDQINSIDISPNFLNENIIGDLLAQAIYELKNEKPIISLPLNMIEYFQPSIEKYNWDYTSYTIYPNNEYYRSYNEHSLHNIKGTQKSKSNN